MKDWDFGKPDTSNLGDHDVFQIRDNLNGKKVALVLTGGIAAIKAPFVARLLRQYGADVFVYATKDAMRFTTVEALEWSTTNAVVTELTSASEHLSDSKPFDAYLVAPATANIINKMAVGIADDAVSTTMAAAIGRMEEGRSKVLIAPTMHHTLHTSILTESLKKLDSLGVRVIPPREKNGKHNIPHEKVLVSEVCRAVSPSNRVHDNKSTVKGKSILVTGGPTPTPIDNVRRITNRFRGRLGIEIAEELYLRGANVMLIHGDGAFQVPKHIPHIVARTYDDYLNAVLSEINSQQYLVGVFSAAVADYQPKIISEGKIASGQNLTLELEPTKKVIDIVKDKYPWVKRVTFKYQENITHEELLAIAQKRLASGHDAVVANRGEEVSLDKQQIAYLLCGKWRHPFKRIGKREIAKGIVYMIEDALL